METVDPICKSKYQISYNICNIGQNIPPVCTCNLQCGTVTRVRYRYKFIFVILTRENVTLQICEIDGLGSGKIFPFVGKGYEIGLVTGIGQVVGIGLFGENGLVVSLISTCIC